VLNSLALLVLAVCKTGGQGAVCDNDNDCGGNEVATACVAPLGASGSCEVACDMKGGSGPEDSLCGPAETCTRDKSSARHYCQRGSFTMDLNLLDSCIVHFIEGALPELGDSCSATALLQRVLDRDGNNRFNIFDVDRCIQEFIANVCVPAGECDNDASKLCAADADCGAGKCQLTGRRLCQQGGGVACHKDGDCGAGLHCDAGGRNKRDAWLAARGEWTTAWIAKTEAQRATARATAGDADQSEVDWASYDAISSWGRCVRECGSITDRGGSNAELQRVCSGFGRRCDAERGYCEPYDDRGDSCQVHGDCLPGSYCFLGRCEGRCYREADCPDSGWMCASDNTCRPRPSPSLQDAGFNPRDYSILFADDEAELSPISNVQGLALLVMNLKTRRQEFDSPHAVFGYRAELQYGAKIDPRCDSLGAARAGESDSDFKKRVKLCTVQPDEQFITLLSPFGTLSASGRPTLQITLDETAAAALKAEGGPGRYPAKLSLFFSNGGSDSVAITLNVSTLEGEYSGSVQVYADGPDQPFVRDRLSMHLDISDSTSVSWTALLAQNQMAAGDGAASEESIKLYNAGRLVTGFIDGQSSLIYDWPDAKVSNRIPVSGIYMAEAQQLRLMGLIDLAPAHCHSDQGPACAGDASDVLQQKNPFGRRLRRLFFYYGTFDERTREWQGSYRETITGLFSEAKTLRGEFHLGQATAQAEDIPFAPLRPSHWPLQVSFAPKEVAWADPCHDIVAAAEMDETGTFLAGLKPHFAAGQPLADLKRFEGQIQSALDALGQKSSGALTLQERLQGQVLFCDQGSEESCIDAERLRCAQALYAHAILKGDAELPAQDLDFGDHVLFCSEFLSTPDCQDEAPELYARHQHNRFHQDLFNTHRFRAGAALSDAVFALYRNFSDALVAATVGEFQEERLSAAYADYGAALQLVLTPAATKLWESWPMRAFAGHGRGLIDAVSRTALDRLETVGRILDVRRRILLNANPESADFLQHLMQYEYLQQVWVLELQREWEVGATSRLSWAGGAQPLFDLGERIRRSVDSSRNPLGFVPRQVYFENDNLAVANWKNYREEIMAPGVGQLAVVEGALQQGAAALREMASGTQALETTLLERQQSFEREIDQLCGPVLPKDRAKTDTKTWGDIGDFDLCDYEGRRDKDLPVPTVSWACAGADCKGVEQLALDIETNEPLCKIGAPKEFSSLQVGAITRPCVRGRVGQLLRQRASLHTQYQDLYASLDESMGSIGAHTKEYLLSTAENQAMFALLTNGSVGKGDAFPSFPNSVPDASFTTLQAHGMHRILSEAAAMRWKRSLAMDIVRGVARNFNCNIGMAVSCPVAAIGAGIEAIALTLNYGYLGPLETAVADYQRIYEAMVQSVRNTQQQRGAKLALDDRIAAAKSQVRQIGVLHQQLTHVEMELLDTWFLAQEAGRMYADSVDNFLENLLAGDSYVALQRNHFVAEADREYQELLQLTYKMAMAFVHRYNMAPTQRFIENRVFQLTTLQDVKDFIEWLDEQERDYCGAAGIDCDAVHNAHTLRVSVRERLFPHLRDIVDPSSGRVLTKGQQFHNLVATPSSPFYRRRVRAGQLMDQVEVPVDLVLRELSASESTVPYLISPLACNHLLGAPAGQGTIGVNVFGTNLRLLRYELKRGHADQVRGCDATLEIPPGGGVPLSTWPINVFSIGYPPQNPEGASATPLTYVSKTEPLEACMNVPDYKKGYPQDESCFHFFARDRSLATTDLTLVVPISGQSGFDNEWLLGQGRSADTKPIIDDIVLYFRHRSRPIED
jgi:hypothetical protein